VRSRVVTWIWFCGLLAFSTWYLPVSPLVAYYCQHCGRPLVRIIAWQCWPIAAQMRMRKYTAYWPLKYSPVMRMYSQEVSILGCRD